MELCQCGHDVEEHDDNKKYYPCDGWVTDGNSVGSIGCYCCGFKERTAEWLAYQDEHRFDDYRPSNTLWSKIRRFLGV